jgi:hypothetical protein
MANKFYDSASAGALTPFDTAATAGTTLNAVIGAITAQGDTVFAKSTSVEAPTATTTFSFGATAASSADPLEVYSVSDFIDSPTTLAKGAAIVSATANVQVIFEGSYHFRGLLLGNSATGNNGGYANFGTIATGGHSILEDCSVVQGATTSVTTHSFWGSPANASAKMYKFYVKDSIFSFGYSGLRIKLQYGEFNFDNISLAGAAASITSLFEVASTTKTKVTIKNSDLTGKTWTNLLVPTGTSALVSFSLENCKLPSGINVASAALPSGYEITLVNCDSGDTTYRYEKHNVAGSITTDAVVYSDTNPLTDKTTPISNKFVSTASSGYAKPLERTYLIPVTSVGTAITPYIEFLVGADGAAALTNKDVVLKVELLADATSTLGSVVTSHPGLLATASNIAAGTVTYTGDGFTTERTHRLETAAITPAQAGYIKLTVQLLKPSTTIYVGVVGVV